MKRTLLLGFALLLFALPSTAAIQYEYMLKTMTEDAVVPTTDLQARAIVDGAKTRVDFIGGNLYPPGNYVVTSDGSRLFFVDPTKKWYTEFNTANAVSAIGASSIKIENLRTDLKQLPDHPKFAGYETTHFQLTVEYDITVRMREIPLKQSVYTVIDNWTTTSFSDLTLTVLANGMRTGNPEIDQMMDLETTKITGFPLKQTVSIRTTLLTRATNSKLKVNPTRTSAREMRVTAIREMTPKPTDFSVPAGYTRADSIERPRIATQVLTFEPPGK